MGKKIFGIDINDLIFLGKGVEGKVFLTPDGNVLKVFSSSNLCRYKYKILKQMDEKIYLPKVLMCKGRFMLREYVNGTPIKEYIQTNGLSRNLALNLIDFVEDFERSRLRVDGISKHVFIQKDESIKIVDPRKKKYYIHSSILRTLKEAEVLEDFLKMLKAERPDLESQWSKAISKLIKK
jgi:predicted Ser/Thr protein kinase